MVKINFFTSFFKNIAFPIGAFFLAMLLWLFVVSGDQYTMMLDLPIEARNLNSQKTYLEEVPGYASVILKGKGRDLFKSYILQNYSDIKLVLDLEGISEEYEFIGLEISEDLLPSKDTNPVPHSALLMAGGRGTRLSPLTDDCPKPLLPINGKPILEIILNQCIDSGITNFYISVHYLSQMIKNYFGDG